jgi:uncharacterized OsmC-like protein
MSTATLQYLGKLRTRAIHTKSGSNLITDAPLDNHGKGEAFSPTDLLAASLASCMLTVMGIYAEQHQINMEGTEVELVKLMRSDPRAVRKIQLRIRFPQNDEVKNHWNQLLDKAKNCPVALSLHPDLEQDLEFGFIP